MVSSSSIRIERRNTSRPRHRASAEPAYVSPQQPAALWLPHGWAKENFGNIAETNTTLWLDWAKQTSNFVPRVFLWQKRMDDRYMHKASLQDAVEEVLSSLRAGNAEIYVSKAQRVCAGERVGWFLSYVKRDDDPPLHFDETVFMAGEIVFRATYIRPVDQPEDTKTREALSTLCA